MRSTTILARASLIALLAATLGAISSQPASAQVTREDRTPGTLASSAGSGERSAVMWGVLWGGLQGMSLAVAMDFGGGEQITEGGLVEHRPESGSAVLVSMAAGGAVGIAGGMLAARRGIRLETVRTAQMGSVWGMWAGLATSKIIGLDQNPSMATMMVVGNAGLLGGAFAGSRWAPSQARIRRMSFSAALGALGGAGLMYIAEVDDRAKYGVGLAGGILGLALGAIVPIGQDAGEDVSGIAKAANALPVGGSLLNRSRGEWSLSAPLPSPSLDPALHYGGRHGADGRGGLAWKVPLLNVRFR